MARQEDAQLKKKLQELLESDKDLRGYALNADVVEGEARLQGTVDTLIEKQRAEELASGLPGIKRVDNAISVSTDGPITDKEVELEVAQELAADPRVNRRHIGAESVKGTVILQGNVRDPDEIEAARRAAAKARGVTEVTSRVRVREPEQTLTELFHSQVRNDNE
ncbi:BON domain-containing protein [Thermanaeromonas sp. C210]|uniref:BON domain-containing protein n=1 Tax=Thermanaeromonas sp. C210 TaxID=2731925 RepID=UPI001567508A|nr:BON domain-containing protein [Thermanaeromonas sp. C210]